MPHLSNDTSCTLMPPLNVKSLMPSGSRGQFRREWACATDKTILWLSPSAKQCRNPCSRRVCTRIWVHDMIGLLRKPLSISDKVERKFETISNNSFGPLGGPEQLFQRHFADVTNRGWIISAMQARCEWFKGIIWKCLKLPFGQKALSTRAFETGATLPSLEKLLSHDSAT